MTDNQQLDHLISVLYETVMTSDLWSEAILLCARQAGCSAAHIMTVDNQSQRPVFLVAAGDGSLPSVENQNNYLNYYLDIDPRMSIMDKTGLNQWRICSDYMNQQFVNRNEFYQDFLIPGGARYAMGIWLDQDSERKTVFGLHRSLGQKPFGNSDQKTAERFINHLQRVWRLQKHTKNLQYQAELGARAIDAFALTMLIVDKKATILHLNNAAEKLLNTRFAGLKSSAGRLSADSPEDNHKLAALVIQATTAPALGGAMFLRSGHDLRTRQVFVTPLPAASPFVKDWQAPLALILILETGLSLSSVQLLGKLYNLSPAELKIVSALLAGKSPEEYALEAGVSLNTVRTQIKTLYRKTGTSRQSELVALLSRTPPVGF